MYQIIDKIADSGTAEIFLARSEGRFVAIKKFHEELCTSAEAIEMFNNEVRSALPMRHRNLAGLYDYGIEDGRCFLVMEMVGGLNLGHIEKSFYKNLKTMPVPVAVFVAAEAAVGMHQAHQVRFHGRLGPQNIMVGFQGDVKVIDFGLAKPLLQKSMPPSGPRLDHLVHMSPEQVHLQKADLRSDIFSLGLLLYEILSQKKVYRADRGPSVAEQMMKEITWLPEVNRQIDVDLAIPIHRALRMNPEDRYASMDAFAKDLREYLTEKFPQFGATELGLFVKKEFPKENIAHQERLFGNPILRPLAPKKTSAPSARAVPLPPPSVPEAASERASEIPEPTQVLAEEGTNTKSLRLRKKIRIRYAHEANPELEEIFENHSLTSRSKRSS